VDHNLIIRQLDWLTKSDDTPARDVNQAAKVFAALTEPKRVTIMGPPNSGKLDVMSILAGNRLVSAELALGTIRVLYGEAPQTQITMSDGSVRPFKGLPTDQMIPTQGFVVQTTIHAPLPALRKISLMRLAEANDLEGQINAMTWAAGQSDTVIWCTGRYGKIEAKMWAHMPDQIRDNAFALLTTLDGHEGNLKAANADIVARVGDDFAYAMAANLKAALSAQVSTPVDVAAMRASGITKLISTLLREIEQGHDNAHALAEILVARYKVPDDLPALEQEAAPAPVEAQAAPGPKLVPDPVSEPMPGPKLVPKPAAILQAERRPAPQNVAQDVQDIVQSGAGDVTPKAQNALDDLAQDFGGKAEAAKVSAKRLVKDDSIYPMFELEPEPPVDENAKAPAPVAEPTALVPALSEGTIAVCNDMIMQLAAVGAADDAQERDRRDMFDASLEALTFIDLALSEVANDDTPQMTRLQGMTEEATDLIQLLRMEDTDSAAMDAITALLQVKRTVHATIAA
jgi:hypothetical protein